MGRHDAAFPHPPANYLAGRALLGGVAGRRPTPGELAITYLVLARAPQTGS